MKSRLIRISGMLAMASSSAAFGLTTEYVNFDNQPSTLTTPVSSDPSQTVDIPNVATITGGLVGNEASTLNGTYVTLPNAYVTAYIPGSGAPNASDPQLSTLTISISPSISVDQVSLPVFNGTPDVLSYQVNAYSGDTLVDSQTLNNIPAYAEKLGAADPDVAVADVTGSNITSVTVTPTTFPDGGGWDFIIDSIAFNQGVVSSLTWDNSSGASPSDGTTWDISHNNNWNNSTAATVYTDGSAVTFNDANNSHYAVTLNTTVSPASTTFINSSGNYTLSGSGSIAGTGALTKSGADSLILSTVNTYTGGTTVTAGTLVADVHGALPDGSLTIAGGSVQLAAGTGATTLTSLSISGGGTLDIGDNHIILSDPGASIDSTIRGYLANGYNNGNWNGTSAAGGSIITSSTTGTKYGIGYADGADGGISGITSGQLEVKYTLYGDANLDGSVNSIDFGDLAANFGKSGRVWDQGDFNYDGTVNSIDFGLLAGNFGKSVGGNADVVTSADWAALDAFAAANGLMADVPEPAMSSLLLFASAGVLVSRRRRASL